VVLLHGATSTRSSVLEQAVVLARHGYGVLLFDARGMGRSGGRAMDFGWYGDRDIEAAVDFVENRPDVDRTRIAALGESMGGEEAIGALAIDSRVRAVVAEGATNRIASDQAWLSDAYGIRGRFQLGVAWLTYGLTDLLTEASPPISLRDAVRAGAPRPVLLIAAGTVADEEHAARDIQAAAPDSVDIWVVPGATHTGGLRAQPADWEQHVVAFLDANVTLPPDRAG
jgi:pimeloyl-ACP methyl ester carboxylesterase